MRAVGLRVLRDAAWWRAHDALERYPEACVVIRTGPEQLAWQGRVAMRREMGEAARQRVETEFTFEKMVAGVLSIYEQTC